MAETGMLAAWVGSERGFELREYPAPGAGLIKVALANVCGSDMHYWKGELAAAKRGRKLPINSGHEHTGTIAACRRQEDGHITRGAIAPN